MINLKPPSVAKNNVMDDVPNEQSLLQSMTLLSAQSSRICCANVVKCRAPCRLESAALLGAALEPVMQIVQSHTQPVPQGAVKQMRQHVPVPGAVFPTLVFATALWGAPWVSLKSIAAELYSDSIWQIIARCELQTWTVIGSRTVIDRDRV